MDEEFIGDDVRRELHYRLIMVKYTNDDPLIQAYMIYNLKNVYDKYKIKMSEKMRNYIAQEAAKISKVLTERLQTKREEYSKLINHTNPFPTTQKSVKERIFSDEEIEKYESNDDLIF